MNQAILHNRRPPKKDEHQAVKNPFMSDVRMREMAKQMGLTPQDFGPEAQAVWGMLDNMAENDPVAYTSFIERQLKNGPPSEAKGSKNDPSEPRFFTPQPGFVVKCAMHHTVKLQQQETKLFINCCGHVAVDCPKNPHSGKDVPADTHAVPFTSNLQIPLAVGTCRAVQDAQAIDVVFHPWVMERCQWDATFKREIMKLAIEWVGQDAKMQLVSRVGKLIKSRYKGGLVLEDKAIRAAAFRIDLNQGQAKLKADPLATPSDLLKQLSQDRESESEHVTVDVALTTKMADHSVVSAAKESTQAPAKRLIEVIESNPPTDQHAHRTISINQAKATTSVASPASPKALTKKKSPGSGGVVKRGFLNSAKTQLYPTGSTEGRAPSAYVKLLDRSKVVDLSEVEEKKKEHTKMHKEALSFLEDTPKKPVGDEDDHGDYEFEQLCMDADPDLQPRKKDERNAVDELLGNVLTKLPSFLSS